MTDTPLLQPDDQPTSAPRRRPWLPIAVVAVLAALLAAGAGWWFFNARATIPDWERLTQLDLAAPAGDAFQAETPWVKLSLRPLRPGEENGMLVSLAATQGTPVAGSGETPRIAALSARPLAADAAAPAPLALQPEPGIEGAFTAMSPLDRAGWWRFTTQVEVEGADGPVEFFLLLPDPNLNGPNAVPGFPSSAEGEAVFRRGIDATTALKSVRFTEWIADGKGNAAVSEHAVTAGGDGVPPGFTYRVLGGMEAVIIGSTRWIKLPGAPGWQQQEGATVVLPSEWGDEYTGATGFTLLGEETIDGEPCQIVAFVAPELSEPRRRTVAWYVWWVGTESGQVRREAMVSRVHYMLHHFRDFDAPLTIAPPDVAGTPAPALTPLPPSPVGAGRGGNARRGSGNGGRGQPESG